MAQKNYIEQIKALLDGSVSGYQNQSNLYNLNKDVENRLQAARQSGWDNLNGTISAVGSFFGGKSGK